LSFPYSTTTTNPLSRPTTDTAFGSRTRRE
jgi:hypothetical protein